MNVAKPLLDWFLGPHSRVLESKWIEVENVGKFYVRYTQTHVAAKAFTALVFSNIVIWKEKQGTLTRLLAEVESALLPKYAVLFENVHNPHLVPFLRRLGYEYDGEFSYTKYVL
jgi:hypothetical protein